MSLDPKTIVFINFIGALLMSIGLLSISKSYLAQIRGNVNWAIATFIQAIGWGLFGLRGHIHDFFSIVVANIALLTCLVLYFHIIAKFNNIKIKLFWTHIPVVILFLVLNYLTFIWPDYNARVIIMSVSIALIMFACSYLLLPYHKKRSLAQAFTGYIFAICGSLMLLRTVVIISFPQRDASFMAVSTLNDILYISYYISSVVLTFGFVLMCNSSYLSERRFAEASLVHAKQILEKSNEIAAIGTWEVDLGSKKVTWSDVTKKIHEVAPDYVVDLQTAINFYKEGESRNNITKLINDAQEQAMSFDVNLEIITAKGNERWVRAIGKSEFNERGCTRIFGVFQDITENVENSRIVKQSEQQLKEAQKIAKIGNYSYNFKSGEWSCSNTVDEISGLKPEELHDFENWKALLAPEFEDLFLSRLWEAVRYGIDDPKNSHDYKIIRPHDGEERWVFINGEIEYDASGNPSKIFGTVQDITERKIVENQLKKSYDEIRMLTNHLESIREEERTHIAREIHDELGQQLTVLRMDIMSLINKPEIALPKVVHVKTGRMMQMVDNSIQTVKKIASELRPGILDDLGLVAALEWQAKEFQKSTEIKCRFKNKCATDNFSEKVNTTVFRIFQESLTNVARHAKATKVCTQLYNEEDMLVLEVKDNGIGINDDSKNKKTSFGLLGMKERATMLKGDILINNISDGGTRVLLKIPI